MKKLFFSGIALCLVLGAANLVSCSDSDTETIYVKTPALADRTVKVGEAGKIEFEAFGDWTLTSSADWCQFAAGSGSAGKQSVAYTVSDAGASFDKQDIADIKLTIGSEEFAFKMTRAALERELKIYDAKGQEVSAVVLDSNGAEMFHADITVAANFPWDLEQTTGWPEWLEKPGRLDPVQDPETKLYTLNFTLTIPLDQLNTRGTESTLTFSDLNKAAFTVKVPVRYFGAEPGFFVAECELGQEITVSKEGYIYDKDGNLTDRNTFDLTVFGGEGLKFLTGSVGVSSYNESEDFGPNTWAWVKCEEVAVRSTFARKNYRVTLSSVPEPYSPVPNAPSLTCVRAYLCLVPPSIYEQWSNISETRWTVSMLSGIYFSTVYDETVIGKKTYSVMEEFAPYVFTLNIKDAE